MYPNSGDPYANKPQAGGDPQQPAQYSQPQQQYGAIMAMAGRRTRA